MRNRAPMAQLCAFDGSAQLPPASAEQSRAGSSSAGVCVRASVACSRLRLTTEETSSIRMAALRPAAAPC